MKNTNKDSKSEIILYQSQDGSTKIDVILENETVWLTQTQMTELFQTTKQNISLHLKNIFSEGELSEDSVVKEYLTTAQDSKKYRTLYYNLDVFKILANKGTSSYEDMQKKVKAELAEFNTNKLKARN